MKEEVKKSFKKDIEQLKKTRGAIEKKSPVVAEISKATLVIIKWVVILLIFILIITGPIGFYLWKKSEAEKKEVLRESLCNKICKYSSLKQSWYYDFIGFSELFPEIDELGREEGFPTRLECIEVCKNKLGG